MLRCLNVVVIPSLHVWLSAPLLDRMVACQTPLLQPASRSPYMGLCHGVRKVEPVTLTETTPGTPGPIVRHASINPRLPRWSKTTLMDFTVTGKQQICRRSFFTATITILFSLESSHRWAVCTFSNSGIVCGGWKREPVKPPEGWSPDFRENTHTCTLIPHHGLLPFLSVV